ncbi:hypothetical protein ACWFRB_06875, partial [Rhodococcus sp. NPDC055112]
HRHTVEFSKNTHTPSPPRNTFSAAPGQLFQPISPSRPGQNRPRHTKKAVEEEPIETGYTF